MIISAEKMALGGENGNPRWRISTRGRCWNRHKGTGRQSTGPNLADSGRHFDQCQLSNFWGSLGVCRPASPVVLISAGGGSGPSCVNYFMNCVFLLDVQ